MREKKGSDDGRSRRGRRNEQEYEWIVVRLRREGIARGGTNFVSKQVQENQTGKVKESEEDETRNTNTEQKGPTE